MAVVLTTKEMMKVLTMMWDCDNNAVMELRCDGGGDGAGDAERESEGPGDSGAGGVEWR